jgi:metallo-beta-lactamase family protein
VNTLTFLGAAGTVTGSRFLLEHDGRRVLVDCGLFQGLRELRRRNWAPFPTDAAGIDAVVLTHAHLDHTGYLPRLVRDGFRGPVVCTADTGALAEIVLRDSAHLQEEDARYARRAGFSKHDPVLPLYDEADARAACALLRPAPFDTEVELTTGVSVLLRPAGHILGSATALVQVGERRVLFSGDLGRRQHPLLLPPAEPGAADVVVVESTYGDRRHAGSSRRRLAAAIRRTVARGGSVLVPAFAVDRTEVVLHLLSDLLRTGEIPDVSVHVDSPMALSAMEVYRRAVTARHVDLRPDAVDPFADPHVRAATTALESQQLNVPGRPCIVVSASGMATGGRVVHHLKHQLPDARNLVVLTGFQAAGTRGRDLLEGARYLKMHGVYVPVRAEVLALDDLSCHADADELAGWLELLPRAPDAVYVVHGEPSSSEAFADRLHADTGWTVVVPRSGEKVSLAAVPNGDLRP